VRTRIHTAELLSTLSAAYAVEQAPDALVRAGSGAPDVLAAHSILHVPGQLEPNARQVTFGGTCRYEDGELAVSGGSTRIVSIGEAGAAVAAAHPIDEAGADYRRRIEDAAGAGLPALLQLAESCRLAATQVKAGTASGPCPKTIRIGIERRGLAAQSAPEEKLTQALFSDAFRDGCATAVRSTIERHAGEFGRRLGSVYKAGARLFAIGTASGLPLLIAFWLPPLSTHRSNETMLLSSLAWAALAALAAGAVVAVRAAKIHRVERRALSGAGQKREDAGTALPRPVPETGGGEDQPSASSR
jgi:hypothetical protein